MPSKILPGHLGNLSQSHEAKLRALWAIGLKFVEICEADQAAYAQKTVEDKYVPPARKAHGKTSVTRKKYPTLVKELLSLLPTDEHNLEKLARRAVEALDHWTPDMYHLMIEQMVKHEHPDALALRFLRESNWDIIQATVTMGKCIYWRSMEAVVEDDLLRNGEGGALEDDRNGRGHAKTVGTDFLKQMRIGKAFLHGFDNKGRPLTYIRVRLHHASDQCPESLERFIIYLLELARLSLQHPVEHGSVVVDLSHLRLANIDLSPIKYLMRCLPTNYPDALGLIMIHNAPYGAKTLWKLLRIFVPSGFASKVKFTRGKKGLEKYIPPEYIMKEYGGQEDWKYQYEEPSDTENIHMQDTITRDRLLAERRILAKRFEDLTNEWIMNAQGSEREKETKARRDQAARDLAANYWQLDPYVRARSLYDRQGCFRGAEGVDWHPLDEEKEEGSVGDDVLEKIPVSSLATADDDTMPGTGAISSGVSVYSNV